MEEGGKDVPVSATKENPSSKLRYLIARFRRNKQSPQTELAPEPESLAVKPDVQEPKKDNLLDFRRIEDPDDVDEHYDKFYGKTVHLDVQTKVQSVDGPDTGEITTVSDVLDSEGIKSGTIEITTGKIETKYGKRPFRTEVRFALGLTGRAGEIINERQDIFDDEGRCFQTIETPHTYTNDQGLHIELEGKRITTRKFSGDGDEIRSVAVESSGKDGDINYSRIEEYSYSNGVRSHLEETQYENGQEVFFERSDLDENENPVIQFNVETRRDIQDRQFRISTRYEKGKPVHEEDITFDIDGSQEKKIYELDEDGRRVREISEAS